VIFRRLLFIFAGATALAVSAGVFVIALAYGEFALAKPYVGSAGASGVVAGSAGLFIGILGLVLANAGKPPKPKPGEPQNVVDALGGAIAAGILAIRNPGYLGAVIRAFVEGRDPPRRGKR
jgi:hypothetical protein